jgi:hypothetical protein
MVSFIWLICWLCDSISWSNLCRSSTNSLRLASNRNFEANNTPPALIRLSFGASPVDAPSLVVVVHSSWTALVVRQKASTLVIFVVLAHSKQVLAEAFLAMNENSSWNKKLVNFICLQNFNFKSSVLTGDRCVYMSAKTVSWVSLKRIFSILSGNPPFSSDSSPEMKMLSFFTPCDPRYRHNKDLVEDIFAEARGVFEDLTSSSEESSCSADSESDDSSENLPSRRVRRYFVLMTQKHKNIYIEFLGSIGPWPRSGQVPKFHFRAWWYSIIVQEFETDTKNHIGL